MNSRLMAKKKKFWSWWWWSWWWPWPSWWSSSWWSWQKWKLSERGHVWAQKYLAQWRKTCSSAKCPSRWFLLRESNGPGNGKLTKLGKYGVRKVEKLFFSTFLELLHLLIGIDINIMFLKFILLRFRDMGLQSSQIWSFFNEQIDSSNMWEKSKNLFILPKSNGWLQEVNRAHFLFWEHNFYIHATPYLIPAVRKILLSVSTQIPIYIHSK